MTIFHCLRPHIYKPRWWPRLTARRDTVLFNLKREKRRRNFSYANEIEIKIESTIKTETAWSVDTNDNCSNFKYLSSLLKILAIVKIPQLVAGVDVIRKHLKQSSRYFYDNNSWLRDFYDRRLSRVKKLVRK